MKRATLTETKNNLSALVDQVRHGETILILDRGRPVAKLESIVVGESAEEGRLARLERTGVIHRGVGEPPEDVLGSMPPRPSEEGASALKALLDERSSGR